MKFLENRIPPPLVAIIFGYAMWAISGGIPQGKISILKLCFVAGITLTGAAFSIAGVMAFHRAKTTVNPLKPATASSLVTSGVYRVSRNPMYVGLALFLVAWTFYLGSFWSFLGVLGFVLYITRFQVAPEERAMLKLFGAEFTNYSKRVRRWL